MTLNPNWCRINKPPVSHSRNEWLKTLSRGKTKHPKQTPVITGPKSLQSTHTRETSLCSSKEATCSHICTTNTQSKSKTLASCNPPWLPKGRVERTRIPSLTSTTKSGSKPSWRTFLGSFWRRVLTKCLMIAMTHLSFQIDN